MVSSFEEQDVPSTDPDNRTLPLISEELDDLVDESNSEDLALLLRDGKLDEVKDGLVNLNRAKEDWNGDVDLHLQNLEALMKSVRDLHTKVLDGTLIAELAQGSPTDFPLSGYLRENGIYSVGDLSKLALISDDLAEIEAQIKDILD